MPIRLKGLHFINSPSFIDKILAIIRPFMKKELMDVLEIHTTMPPFLKSIPQDMLPNELGGKAGTIKDMHSKYS